MNTKILFICLILLLGIFLFSFLGSKHSIEGLTNNNDTQTYVSSNGAIATITTYKNGTKNIQIKETPNSKALEFVQSSNSNDTFTNSYGLVGFFSNGTLVISNPNNGPSRTFKPFTVNTSSNASNTDSNASNTNSNSSNSYNSSNKTTTSNKLLDSSLTSNLFSITPYLNTPGTQHKFDNYNHFNGFGSSIQLQNGTIFIDPTGSTITVIINSDGTKSLRLQNVSSSTSTIFTSKPNNSSNTITAPNTFYANTGGITATAFTGNDGQISILLQNGKKYSIFSQEGSSSNSLTNTQYYGSTGYSSNPSSSTLSYTSPNTSKGKNNYGSTYYSALPQGVNKNQIPLGNEDKYILKSQIVPPVCPVCPVCSTPKKSNNKSNKNYSNNKNSNNCHVCGNSSLAQPYTYKKVPNYNAIDKEFLPQPVLSDFSQFGM
jgi:hypothetical protein